MADSAKKSHSGEGVTDKDLGWRKMIGLFEKAGALKGKLGNTRKKKYPGQDSTVGKVMAIQEARTGFVTKFLEKIQPDWEEFVAMMADRILLDATDPADVLQEFLEAAVEDLRDHIKAMGLVDTGLLRDAQNFKITGRGK